MGRVNLFLPSFEKAGLMFPGDELTHRLADGLHETLGCRRGRESNP